MISGERLDPLKAVLYHVDEPENISEKSHFKSFLTEFTWHGAKSPQVHSELRVAPES
jgi:hypothetical protein